jgi:hypothetical protein
MNGQALDQMSGVQGLLTRGQDNYREVAPTGDVPTGTDLLARTPSALSGSNVVGGPEDVGFGIDAEWLDDVHSPTLVITRAYIGPDRRPSDRWVPGSSGPPARPAITFRINWVRRIAQIVCITMAVALPPTLIAARSLPPAPSPPPKVPGSLARSGVRPFAASARQVARADAAHQRFLARQEAASEAAFRRPDAVASAATGARATRVRAVGMATVAGPRAARFEARAAAQQHAVLARARTQAAPLRRSRWRVARVVRDSGGGNGRHPRNGSHVTPPAP